MSCTGTPISWLRLEQFHAGDLAKEERDAIAAHLASCDACAACSKWIEADARDLPALPQPARVFTLRRAAPVIAMLAAAAAILLVVGRNARNQGSDPERVKGADIAFALVREDETVIGEAGTAIYRDGDRFKAVVTCPPGVHGAFDLVVYENGVAAFPLEAQSDLQCGNAVSLPGAFRVTGRSRMTACLVWADGAAVDRDAVRRTPPDALPHALCKSLEPAL